MELVTDAVPDKSAAQVESSDDADVQTKSNVSTPEDEQNIQLEARINEKIFGRTSHKRFNAHHAHVPSDENDMLIQTINDMDLGWKADTCKLQKHHPNYGSHCAAQSTVLAQVQAKSDLD